MYRHWSASTLGHGPFFFSFSVCLLFFLLECFFLERESLYFRSRGRWGLTKVLLLRPFPIFFFLCVCAYLFIFRSVYVRAHTCVFSRVERKNSSWNRKRNLKKGASFSIPTLFFFFFDSAHLALISLQPSCCAGNDRLSKSVFSLSVCLPGWLLLLFFLLSFITFALSLSLIQCRFVSKLHCWCACRLCTA